jgi:S1-C subfamily serine protease
LEPNKTFGQPFAPAFAGAILEGDGNDYKIFRVTDVLQDSPASEAGLQKGDVITAVDGRPASELSVSEISEMFERPGFYSLNVQRDHISLHITLRPTSEEAGVSIRVLDGLSRTTKVEMCCHPE